MYFSTSCVYDLPNYSMSPRGAAPTAKSTDTRLSTAPRFGNRPDLAHLSRILALSRGCYQQLINV